MIEGLKLTMTGEELRGRLAERVKHHEELVERYEHEAKREPNRNDEDDFVLPEHMCEYEQQLHEWRAETLSYLREHIEGGEVYRLGPADLEFGEILPEKPGMVEQEEYEREQRVGFSLERIAKEIGRSGFGVSVLGEAMEEHRRVRAAGKTGVASRARSRRK